MSTKSKAIHEYFTAPEIIYISNDDYFKSNQDKLEFSHKYINIDNSSVTKQCIDIDEQFNVAYICNIKFEPLQKNLVLKFKNKQAKKRKRKKKHTEESYLKMKVHNLLHFILDRNDTQRYDVSSVSQLLISKIKQIFKYHIQDNPSIFNTNKKLITAWKSKLFFVIALDLCYENITKSRKYDMNFSMRRLEKIIEYRINYFIVTRTFFGHTLKLDGIRAYELNTHNFNQLAWTELYFDKRCVVYGGENLLNFKDDTYMDSTCSYAVQLGNIVDDIKQVLGEEECSYNVSQQINIKQLLIGNRNKIIKICKKSRHNKSNKKASAPNSDALYIINNIDKCDIVQIYSDKCSNLLDRMKRDLFIAKKQREINTKKNVKLELKVIKLTESVNNLIDIKEQKKEPYQNEIVTQQNFIRAQVEFYLSDYNLKKNKRLLLKMSTEPERGYLPVEEILKLFNSSISHSQLYESLKKSPYIDMILHEKETEDENDKNNKMIYGKVKILGRMQKKEDLELEEFHPIYVGRKHFTLCLNTNIQKQKQKQFAIINNIQRKKTLSFDSELGNLLRTLPMHGVIEYDAKNTFWIVKLGNEWQENTANFAQLTDKIYCNEVWYKCGMELGRKYAKLLHERDVNIATVGPTSMSGVHITLGRCDINNMDKPFCFVVGDEVKFKIKRLVSFPPFSSKPKNFKRQEIDAKGYRYYATHWITLEIEFIAFSYKTRCTPHISLCKIAVKLKADDVQKLNDREKKIKQLVGKKGGAILSIIHEEESDDDMDIKEAEKKGVYEKNEADEMQQINIAID